MSPCACSLRCKGAALALFVLFALHLPRLGRAAPTVSIITGRLLQRQLAAGRLANPGWVLGTASGGQVVLGIPLTTKLPTSSQGWLAQNTVKLTGYYSGYTFIVSSAQVLRRNSGGDSSTSGAQKALVYALTVCGQSALDPATGRPPAAENVWDYLLNSQDSLGATWKRCSFGKVAFDASASVVQTIDVGCQYDQPQDEDVLRAYGQMANEAALQAGVNGSAFYISFFLFPAMPGCSWPVLAPAIGQQAIYLNGWAGLAAKDLHLHEGGHALNLGDGRFGGDETGDGSAAMGKRGKAGLCFSLPQQVQLGWHAPSTWVDSWALPKGSGPVAQILKDVMADKTQGLRFVLSDTPGWGPKGGVTGSQAFVSFIASGRGALSPGPDWEKKVLVHLFNADTPPYYTDCIRLSEGQQYQTGDFTLLFSKSNGDGTATVAYSRIKTGGGALATKPPPPPPPPLKAAAPASPTLSVEAITKASLSLIVQTNGYYGTGYFVTLQCWGSNYNPPVPSSKNPPSSGAGPFSIASASLATVSVIVTGLARKTQYRCGAYTTSSGGQASRWSKLVSLTTAS